MSRDRQSDPLKALSRVTRVLRSSRIDRTTLRRALEAATIGGILGLRITEGPDRTTLASAPTDFVPGAARWSTPLHRGHLEATGHDLRTEPFPTYLDTLAGLISQSMRAQERVESTRQEFRTLFGSIPAAVAMQRHGTATWVNAAWTVLTGGVNVGQSVLGWILEQDRDRAARAVEHALPEPVEVRLAYDPSRWVELEATTQMAFDGQQVSLVVAREITAQRARHADRAIADRLDTMRWLTSSVAHELNNPLTAVMANLEVARFHLRELRPSHALNEDLAAELTDAQEASERMRMSIRDLRDIGRSPGTDAEPVDIRRVVDAALALMRRRLGHRCHIERHYDAQVPQVVGRADGLGQVMVALIRNAAEAFARHDAQTGPQMTSHRLEIWIQRHGREVSVVVADDGPGVPPEMESGLFEPFVGYGTGLGLTLARRIVEELGGTLRYDRRGGAGSLFRVRLPVAEANPIGIEPQPAQEIRGRVLVVDDEPMIGRAVRRMLEPSYEVVVATNGAEGLETLTETPDWDLVLLDLMMPGMGGVDVYEEIERQLPELLGKVAVVTGGIYTEHAHRFLERTRCTTLSKPFDVADLERALRDGRTGSPTE